MHCIIFHFDSAFNPQPLEGSRCTSASPPFTAYTAHCKCRIVWQPTTTISVGTTREKEKGSDAIGSCTRMPRMKCQCHANHVAYGRNSLVISWLWPISDDPPSQSSSSPHLNVTHRAALEQPDMLVKQDRMGIEFRTLNAVYTGLSKSPSQLPLAVPHLRCKSSDAAPIQTP